MTVPPLPRDRCRNYRYSRQSDRRLGCNSPCKVLEMSPINATSSAVVNAAAGGAPFALVTPMDTYTVVPCVMGLVTELALELEAQPFDVVERQSVVVVGVKVPTSRGANC